MKWIWLDQNQKFAYQRTGFIKIRVYLHLSVANLNYRMISPSISEAIFNLPDGLTLIHRVVGSATQQPL
jgi:hypothetical protein